MAMVTVSCGNKNYSLFPLPCLQDAGLPARARADKDHTMSLQMCTDSSERMERSHHYENGGRPDGTQNAETSQSVLSS